MIKKKSLGIIFSLSLISLGCVGFSTFYISNYSKDSVLNIIAGDIDHTGYVYELSLSSLNICKDGFIHENGSITNIASFSVSFNLNIEKILDSTTFLEDSTLELNINLIENNEKNLKFINNENVSFQFNLYAFDSMNNAVRISSNSIAGKENESIINLHLEQINSSVTLINVVTNYIFDFGKCVNTSFETDVFDLLKDTSDNTSTQINSIYFTTTIEVIG